MNRRPDDGGRGPDLDGGPATIRDKDGTPTLAPPPRRRPHACTSGWVGADAEGRPIPCTVCRPWLARGGRA